MRPWTCAAIPSPELRQHKVDMRQNLGEKTGLYDIPTLEEAIAAVDAVPAGGEYASVGGKKVVLFLEAKDGPAQAGLVKFITERGLQRRTVIKMYRDGSGGFKPTSRYLKLANSAAAPPGATSTVATPSTRFPQWHATKTWTPSAYPTTRSRPALPRAP